METNPEGVYASYRNFLPAGLTGLILKETMLLQIDTFSQQAYRWPKPLAALGVIHAASLSLASLASSLLDQLLVHPVAPSTPASSSKPCVASPITSFWNPGWNNLSARDGDLLPKEMIKDSLMCMVQQYKSS
jgi:hypothetical protein